MNYVGVKPCCVATEHNPNYINEDHVPLGWHATFLCLGTQDEQRKIRRLGRQRVLSLEADFSVTLKARRMICLIRKTKKARDITLALDWPSGAGMFSTVLKKVLESSITSALMPTASKKTLVHKL